MITAESVKQFALDKGVNLVGVAPVERFGGAPAGHHPTDILPGATSVVVCAKPIPTGVFDGPATSYQISMDAVHLQLDLLATQVALFLEGEGGRRFPYPPMSPTGIGKRSGAMGAEIYRTSTRLRRLVWESWARA